MDKSYILEPIAAAASGIILDTTKFCFSHFLNGGGRVLLISFVKG